MATLTLSPLHYCRNPALCLQSLPPSAACTASLDSKRSISLQMHLQRAADSSRSPWSPVQADLPKGAPPTLSICEAATRFVSSASVFLSWPDGNHIHQDPRPVQLPESTHGKPPASIRAHGKLKAFPLRSGPREGRPLSPLLFNTAPNH